MARRPRCSSTLRRGSAPASTCPHPPAVWRYMPRSADGAGGSLEPATGPGDRILNLRPRGPELPPGSFYQREMALRPIASSGSQIGRHACQDTQSAPSNALRSRICRQLVGIETIVCAQRTLRGRAIDCAARSRPLVCARADPHPLAMATWLQAFLWGLLAGSALLAGALLGWFAPVPRRAIAGVMGFGAGVLLSALSFDLMGDSFSRGGAWPTALGFGAGAIAYAAANVALARRGAKHRKRSGKRQPSESEQDGSGLAIAVGALLDGIPESAAIGVSLLAGHGVGMVAVIAIFISNLPEGLSSSAGMKAAGRSGAYVFGIWVAIAVLSAISAALGAVIFKGAPGAVAATLAVAAGAILTMIADTMVPEAFEESHDLAGLITVLGFLCAFLLTKLGG